ncbi:uncharacterized protein LOC143429964 [Xylocopa sonorina]|uniref:uncharacterized protein LOC143429964 n=1 Tax=Xylocopa sonorina TaxID=1818115 RepID=UPI00403A8647
MKLLVMILLPLVTVMAGSSIDMDNPMAREMLIQGLADVYSIEKWQVDKCLQKMGTKPIDIFLLQESNNIDESSLRKSTCALTCCAQVAGLMTGSKLEMKAIYAVIEHEIEAPLRLIYMKQVDECAEIAKNQTDECMVGYKFLKCFIQKSSEVV